MTINDKIENKNKGFAFIANMEKDKEQKVEDTDDNLPNSIALLAKKGLVK